MFRTTSFSTALAVAGPPPGLGARAWARSPVGPDRLTIHTLFPIIAMGDQHVGYGDAQGYRVVDTLAVFVADLAAKEGA